MYAWIKDGKAPPPLTLTTGMLTTRANVAEVRKEMGL
jgi:L-arabinose transport system substrate-binding protein